MRTATALLASIAGLATSVLAAGVTTAAAPSGSPPAGFQRIVDDTGTVAISVPADWGNVSTAPAVATDRTVNPTILTQHEFTKRVTQKEAFLARVLSQPKLWLIGSENDLSA